MIQRDYILRMIQMLGDLLAAILGLIRKGDYSRASENLSQIYYDLLKQDAAFFRTIAEDELTEKLLEQHNYTNGHLEILAELFNAEAELSMAQGNTEEGLAYTRKALILFEYIDKAYRTFSKDRFEKISALNDRLGKKR
jgi:hypothetical protein